MNRRDFLLGSSIALTAGFVSSNRSLAQTASVSGALGSYGVIRSNVGYFSARGGTIGWLLNSTAVVAIDTQFPDTAAAFAKDLPGRGGRHFDFIVNTHHHGDHTGGNSTLRDITRSIVAHANVPELMQLRAKQDNRLVDPKSVPDQTFVESWTQAVGDEVLSAHYFGAAHTRGDIVVVAERANVIHVGDLMFNRIYPVIDRPGGAGIRGWITVLEKIAARYPSDTVYIFGHANPKFGVTGSRADLLVFRDYLSGLLDYTRTQIRAGKTKPETVALENLPGFPDFHQSLPNRLGQNLGVAYDELIMQTG